MLAANAYVIRRATAADRAALDRLAALDSSRPLGGDDVLIGEIDGVPAAAISPGSGRVIADPFKPTSVLLVHLRIRAAGIQAAAATPSVRDRIRAGIRVATADAT